MLISKLLVLRVVDKFFVIKLGLLKFCLILRVVDYFLLKRFSFSVSVFFKLLNLMLGKILKFVRIFSLFLKLKVVKLSKVSFNLFDNLVLKLRRLVFFMLGISVNFVGFGVFKLGGGVSKLFVVWFELIS